MSLPRAAAAASRLPKLATNLRYVSRQISSIKNIKSIKNNNNATAIRTSATSAINFKAKHKKKTFPPLPVVESPSWETHEAVSNILYNLPTKQFEAHQHRHILHCIVQNEPGVLSRVSGILAGRGFNIDSLVVCNTEVKEISRMTIVLRGVDTVIEQARRQLEDLVPVWACLDYSRSSIIERELLLCKVSLLGPEYFKQLKNFHQNVQQTPEQPPIKDAKEVEEPKQETSSEIINKRHGFLQSITLLTDNFHGKIVDISEHSVVIELCAKASRINNFLALLKPFGVLEVSRSGVVAFPRSFVPEEDQDANEDSTNESEAVNLTSLPPG